MNNKNILVIGDTILDETVICDVVGTSLETPTLKTQLSHSFVDFGGASNVVNNLLALGANVTYVSVIGQDKYTDIYKNWENEKLNFHHIKEDRENVVKSRYWIRQGGAQYKYLQINSGQKAGHNDETIDKILEMCHTQKDVECILLIDYSIGIFRDEKQIKRILDSLKKLQKPIIVSSQLSSNKNNYPLFRGVDYMCMNKVEAIANLGTFMADKDHMKELSKVLDTNVCVTLGEAGCMFIKEGELSVFDSFKVEAVDTCGAGDAFLAAFSMFVEEGDLSICNRWAALSTTHTGTQTPSVERLYENT